MKIHRWTITPHTKDAQVVFDDKGWYVLHRDVERLLEEARREALQEAKYTESSIEQTMKDKGWSAEQN
jgi:hypothetical protein